MDLDAHPLRIIEQLFGNIYKNGIFIKRDLKSAYHQIPILDKELICNFINLREYRLGLQMGSGVAVMKRKQYKCRPECANKGVSCLILRMLYK